jgi:curved DNA-binding protein CbpA
MVPKLLVVAVEFYRAQARFGYLTDPSQPLPHDFDVWLSDSCAAVSPRNLETTAAALGIAPKALHDAFLFFLRCTLLVPEADHYRVLGLPRGCSTDAVKQHHGLLVNLFHPDRGPGEDAGRVELTARINAAYRTLRDAKARARYDAQLAPLSIAAAPAPERFDAVRRQDARGQKARSRRASAGGRRSAMPFVLGALGAVAASVLVFPVFMKSEEPELSMRPGFEDIGVPRPAYLREADRTPSSRAYTPSPEPTETERDVIAPVLGAAPREQTDARMPAPSATARHRQTTSTETIRLPPEIDPPARPKGTRTTRETLLDRQLGPDPVKPDADSLFSEASTRSDEKDISSVRRHDATILRPNAPATSSSSTRDSSGRDPSASEQTKALATRPLRPSENDAPAVTPPQPSAARQSDPPAQRAKSDSPGLPAAARVIRKLKRLYAKGDLDGLTRVFTVNAVLNQGAGRAHIRQWYAAAFERDRQRALSIFNLRWREGANQRLLGDGQILLTGRDSPTSKWRQQRGTVQIELVPWQDQYYIGKLIHRVSGR